MASERQISSQEVSDAARASSPDDAAQETHGLASADSPPASASPPQSPRPSPFPSAFLSFREPANSIKQLRQLALQGREETLREEAEGREKVVWGTVDAQVRREEGGVCVVMGDGTLPGAEERLEACEVGGVAVGDGNGGGIVDDGGVVGGSALGLARGERPLNEGRRVL